MLSFYNKSQLLHEWIKVLFSKIEIYFYYTLINVQFNLLQFFLIIIVQSNVNPRVCLTS
jgi:hypothetical protein